MLNSLRSFPLNSHGTKEINDMGRNVRATKLPYSPELSKNNLNFSGSAVILKWTGSRRLKSNDCKGVSNMTKRILMVVLGMFVLAAVTDVGPRLFDAPYPQCLPCPLDNLHT